MTLGIGDDCAILRPAPGDEVLVTTDFALEGRHFRRDWHPPESAGHRTLARGLSDLAAMGARPIAAFLSLALPPEVAREQVWAERFLDGLLRLAERAGVPLAGGDLAESPTAQVLADIVLVGAAPAGTSLRRSGARAGDCVYVTGSLGGSAAELRTLSRAARSADSATPTSHPQLYPEPRLGVGLALRETSLATACMDLSDGLSTDLSHLCQASQVRAVVELALLPASPWLQTLSANEQAELMLHGGEDYELLFTARPETRVPKTLDGVPLWRIGTILPAGDNPEDATVVLRSEHGDVALQAGGWEHLR